MLFLVTRPARERDCPPRTGDEEPRHPRTMGPSPLPVMLAEPTGPGAAGKVPGRMDSHGGHRTGSVPSGAAGATKPLPSGLYRIARIAPKRAGGGVKALTKTGGAPSAQASGPPVWTLRASGGGRSNSCIISVSRGTCSRRRKVSRTSFARTIVSARSGGNWRGSSAGGEIDQAESARFRQDENRSESRNSGLRVEKRGLKRPGGPAFQDSGPPAWTFCCGSDRYCSGSHSQKPCIPTAFAGQGSWVTSASSHRCRPLLKSPKRSTGSIINGGVPSVDLAIHHLGVHLPDGHQPCSTEHFPERRRRGSGGHACRIALMPVSTLGYPGRSLGAREGPLSWAFVLLRGLRWCSQPIAWEAASSSFQASCGPKQSETPTVRAS